jgi:hypothetical protein
MRQEALKLALPLLEDCVNSYGMKYERPAFVKAIIAVKEALAQPEQEPSGHFLDFAYSDSIAYVHVYDQFRKGQQFYKAPIQRTWVGLTDEERSQLVTLHHGWNEYGQAIEAKLKERNT